MDGRPAKAQSKALAGVQSLKRPLDLPELYGAAKLPNLGQQHAGNSAPGAWVPGSGAGGFLSSGQVQAQAQAQAQAQVQGQAPLLGCPGQGPPGLGLNMNKGPQATGGALGFRGPCSGSARLGAGGAGGGAGAGAFPPNPGPSPSSSSLGLNSPAHAGPAGPALGAPGGPLALGLPHSHSLPVGPPLPGAGSALGGAPSPVAAGSQQQVALEIPQDKVQLVMGVQGATIKAIKAISGASCFLQQTVQPSEKALLTMGGSQAQVEKCQGLVLALIDGANVPGSQSADPAAAAAVAAAASSGALPAGLPLVGGLASLPRPPNQRHLSAGPAQAAGMKTLPVSASASVSAGGTGTLATSGTLPSSGPGPGPGAPGITNLVGSAGGIDPGKLAGLAGAGGGSLGSLSSILSGVLNTTSNANPGLYTQLLTAATQLVSSQAEATSEVAVRKEQPQAFDREALKRLAQQAQESQDTDGASGLGMDSLTQAARILPPASVVPELSTTSMQPQQPLVRQSQEVLQGQVRPTEAASYEAAMATPSGTGLLGPSLGQGFTPGPGSQVKDVETEKETIGVMGSTAGGNKKDSSSVLGILQQAQDNAARGRVGRARGQPAQAPALARTNPDVASASASASSNNDPAGVGTGTAASTSAAPELSMSLPSPPSGDLSGSSGLAGQLASLQARLESPSLATVSPDARRSLEREVLAMLQKLEPRRLTELALRVFEPFSSFASSENSEGQSQRGQSQRSGSGSLRDSAPSGLKSIWGEDSELLEDVTRRLTPQIPRFGSPDLTRLTAALERWALETAEGGEEGRLRHSEELRAFFNGVSTEVSLRLMDVAPGDLAKIASSLASVGLGGARLFASIARAAVARSDRFAPHELVALVVAFDKARFFQTSLFEALARCLKTNVKDVAPKDMIQGMRLLATCGIQDKDLGQAIGEHMPRKATSGSLSAEEFCTLAWTFCALDLHHDQLFRSVFQALEDAATLAGESLCQLYEIHLTLKAFHHESYREYELEDDTVQNLREHYRRHKGGSGRVVKLERSSERVHSDVADQLRDVIDASVSTAHQVSLGFTVDVAATRRKSSQSPPLLLVEIDGPHSLVRSLDPMDAVGVGGHTSRVRGAAALKRRVLHKHGFRMGVVNEDEWRTMSKSKEKREFLRDLLVKAGVSSDRLL